jgi:hypothetical protein
MHPQRDAKKACRKNILPSIPLNNLIQVVFFCVYDNKITTFGRPAMVALFITEFLVSQ